MYCFGLSLMMPEVSGLYTDKGMAGFEWLISVSIVQMCTPFWQLVNMSPNSDCMVDANNMCMNPHSMWMVPLEKGSVVGIYLYFLSFLTK